MAVQETKIENALTIDGRLVEFVPGETILEAARRNGIYIPTLCHLKGATPTGACRVCVTELVGPRAPRALVTACTMPAAKGMDVKTHSPRVLSARRNILELLLASGNHNCSVRREITDKWTQLQQDTEAYDQSDEICEVYGECLLQSLAYRYQVDSSHFEGQETEYPMENASLLILRDFSRCILCGRCVQACNDIQHNNAISHAYRGRKAKIVGMGDEDLDRSECVFCGDCIQVCPVGALAEAKTRYRIRPWEAEHVRSTCHYCSVGCQLDLLIKDGKVMKVRGVESAEPNHGHLCMKGRFGFDFLASDQRLTRPMIRENGALRDAGWDEALDLVAGKIRETTREHGADAVAAIASGKSSNETLFTAQKFFRAAVGTNNVLSPFSSAGMSDSLASVEKAEQILLIGSDITRENPVVGSMILRAVARGCKLIVIDDEDTRVAGEATLHLRPREGTESVLVNGIIRRVLETGPGRGFEEERKIAESFPMEKVVGSTGLAEELIEKARRILVESKEPTMLLYGSKVAGWAPRFRVLQDVLGNTPLEGGGTNPLPGLNNSVGAVLMGMTPGRLPGMADLGDASERGRFEQAWDCSLSAQPGRGLDELLGGDAPARLLYCARENPVLAAGDKEKARAAVEAADFVVVQDLVLSEMTESADVVLPVTAWAEEEGTYTNCERRVNLSRAGVEAPGEARSEIWIYRELARRLGQEWPERDSREIWESEIVPLVPQVAGISYDRLEDGGLQWPVPEPESTGTPFLDGESLPPAITAWGGIQNYHHFQLLEKCEGLLASLPESMGGTRSWPSDPGEVTRRFEALLEADEKSDKKAGIDEVLARYRPRRGGLIPVLQIVQETLGYLAVPAQNYIALGLGLSAANVYGVVSFYSFFTMTPRGRYTIRVCLGTACFVKGAGAILENLEESLGIKVGETTEDREFSLEGVRCVGACGLAPVVVVGDDTHGMIDPAKASQILDKYRGASDDV